MSLGRKDPWRVVPAKEAASGGTTLSAVSPGWMRVRLETGAGLRDSGLCPRDTDWPRLTCILKRWPWCPGLRQGEGVGG